MKTRKLALALAGAAAITLLPSAAAMASATPTPASAVKLPGGVTFNPKTAKCKTVTTAAGTSKSCVQITRLSLEGLTTAQRAERKRMMTELENRQKHNASSAAPAATPPAGTESPAAEITAPAACQFTSDQTLTYVPHPSRFLSCDDGLWTVQHWRIAAGVVSILGTFLYEDQQWASFSASGVNWTHGMQTLAYPGFGDLADGVSGTLYSNCYVDAGACYAVSTGTPDPQPVTLTPGNTYTFEWNEQDAGPAATTTGDVDTLDTHLGVVWDLTVGGSPWINTETGGLAGRCDSEAGTDSADTSDDSGGNNTVGCVDEDDIPTLELSVTRHGSAATMVAWAQYELAGHWGLQGEGQPLSYLQNKEQRDINRDEICEDGTFTNLGTAIGGDDGSSDSCDEFPFAATYQSAGYAGYVGADCAQVQATEIAEPTGDLATDWIGIESTSSYTGSEPCVRGHTPGASNSLVGTDYSKFLRDNRMLDTDQFWVEVQLWDSS